MLTAVSFALAGHAVPVAAQGASGSPAPPGEGQCEFIEPERRLAALLTGSDQQRPRLTCRPGLQEFARRRARDMAQRGYLAHLTPEREGPNELLRGMGYPLPQTYRGGLANNIESIAGGIRSPDDVWRALTESKSHRAHILGEHPAYLEQDEFGIAYERDIYAPHVDYWVVIIARKARPGEDRLICTPEPAECFRLASEIGRQP